MPEWARRWGWELLLAGILIGVLILNVSLSPFYLGVQNVINTFQLSIEKVIVAVIMAFVIVNGEIDLSVASVMAFSASVLAALHAAGAPFGLAVGAALLTGAIAGLFQGFFVAGLARVVFAARLGSVRGDRGEGFEFDIITMVLLRGVSIFGGSGAMVGVG